MNTFILIMVMASGYREGAASISQEFNTETACKTAGQSLATNVHERHAHVITWGCYSKGKAG